MSALINPHTAKRARRHAVGPDGRALCGGGNGGKSANLQTDFTDEVDCLAYLDALKRAEGWRLVYDGALGRKVWEAPSGAAKL